MAAYAALLSLARTTDLRRPQYESIFTSDAVEKVRSIHDYVNFLLSFFEEFPEKINRWECRIRDVASDAEDIIEVFVWQRIQSRRDSTIYPSRVLEDQLQDVTIEIGSIAGEVMEERPPYRPPPSSSSSGLAAASNDAVVGLKKDVMEMMEQLCGQSSHLHIIPIVGMGGIGKSTLARTLYDHRYMLERFDIRAWVVVSQDYNPHRFRKVLFDSMRLLDKEQMSGDEMDDSEIALKVYQNLKGRRYLIVIDDIWSTEVWDDVRSIFPDDNNGSRIMLTTRQSDVATYPASNSPVHEMQFMNEAQSWDLLKQKVFGNSNCPHELEDVGKEIARRCAGLPLAVVLVAGVLSQENNTQASWEEIAKNVNPVVGREIGEILSLSYTYLPHHLRPCILFIGYFMEDVNISSSRLIKLWVAEGFVKHKHGCSKSLEEEAEEYMEDLVKRNLMIVTSRKSDGKIKSCTLHDMVRDLCMSKAHEEKFLHERDGRYLPLMYKRRIISSHSDKTTIWGAAFHTILGSQNIPSLLRSYKLLRVLDALAVNLNNLPSEAFELYHLRYLAVMGSFSIPSLVYNLGNLQTLIVHLASGKPRKWFGDGVRRSLPFEIWRMPQLRHLFFHAPYMLPHPLEGINYLTLENLSTLLHVQDLVWNKEIIRMIPNVKRLGLHYTTSQEYHLYHLKDMQHLVKLEVTGYLKFSWSIEIPRSFPCTLKKLTLVGGGFPWEGMVVVGSLPCLQVLKLLGNACDGDTWEITDEEFPQLEVLLIDESGLREWITHGSPFPTLKHLVLRSCWYLREIPEDLGEIPTLELIELDDCTKSLFESAKKIKEDQEENCGDDTLQVRFGHEEIEETQGTIVSGSSAVRSEDLLTITEAEEMAGPAVTFLLDNVQKLLVEQISLIWGAEEELKALHKELELMKAFLMGPANKCEKGELFIEFGRQIKEAVYEAEDTLDACLTHKAISTSRRLPHMNMLDLSKNLKKVLQVLQSKFDRARNRLNKLPVVAVPAARPRTSDDKRRKTHLLREDNVVGFEDEEATLIKYLKQPTEGLDVISIVGMPGLGKTTLAWKIYCDPSIQFEFPTLIWVNISKELNVREVFLTILKKFTHQDMSGIDNLEVTQLVRSHLEKGKFLLFIDDVWTIGDWRQIEAVLPRNNKLGKVLVTSRHVSVATQANHNREPHELRFMTFDESWELLQLEVFGKNNTCPIELEELGKDIAKQCGGIPLAVVVTGGILVEKCVDRRDLWEKVLDDVSAHLQDDEENVTENIISLSYNKLPHDLRDCFLYLGMFPEDTEISAWKLTRLWIAEGFIQRNTRSSLEKVAEDKLNNLIARNLVMVEKTKANGDVKTCRVHDMIRKFCQNLFPEVKKTWQGVFDLPISEIVMCRRICIHSHVMEFLLKKPKGPRVRSFVCFSKDTIILPTEYASSIHEAFDLLRVIDVNPIKFTEFPPKFTELMHLSYISLSGNEFKSLPEAVSKLWNLQTVEIDTTSREFEIKFDISRMMQLRHLKTKAAITIKKLKGGGGENLQTLSRLSAECCKEELFTRASNLKNLGIRGNLINFVDANYLGKLEHLEKLKLVHDVFPTTADNALHRVPHQHNFPPNLRILTLSSTYLNWKHIVTLGSLNKLEVLKLKDMAFRGRSWEARGGGFPHLESLHIARTDLETWTASGDPFPKLKNLILKNCERLQEIPLQLVKSLQLLEIEHVTASLVESAKKINAEKLQMQEGQVRAKWVEFKLKISPGDASATTSSYPN